MTTIKELSFVKKIIYGSLAFLIMVGSAFGVTKIFVLKPVHDLELKNLDASIAGVAAQVIEMQKNNQKEAARNDVRYWQKVCRDIRQRCGNNWTQACQLDYNAANAQLQRAQNRLDQLSR